MKRIVHLGLGNFHRAHQAWYTAQMDDWRITGVVMTNRDLHNQLTQHDKAYNLGIWDQNGLRCETISVYDDVLLATQNAQDVITKIADPDTHVITLTVTEKGYNLDAAGQNLDISAPAIADDLNAATPRSAVGLLAAGLAQRSAQNGAPLTALSCDNLAENGHKLRQIIMDYLAVKSPDAIAWAQSNVTFPNSMVDRITPRLSAQAIDEISALSKAPNLSTVGTEDFSEWVIEDRFAGPRPDWDAAGAVFVKDVSSFENRKLRLLNASHSYLAYAGLLAGHRFVHEAIADPELRQGVNALWDEAAPSVPAPASNTLKEYRQALLDRFAVPALRHELAQIAMDGSMKIRERLLPIVTENTQHGRPCPQAKRAVTTWIDFVRDQFGKKIALNDPKAGEIARVLQSDLSIEDQDEALLAMLGASHL